MTVVRHPHFASLVVSDGKALWDRQKKEPAKAWANFCMYRDMPPGTRSMERLAKLLNRKSWRRLEMWSARWNWVERAVTYDAEMDRLWSKTKAGEIELTVKRHKHIAQLMQWVSKEELSALKGQIEAGKQEAEKATAQAQAIDPNAPRVPRPTVIRNPNVIVRLGKDGALLERLILGETTENPGVATETDYSKLSVEELAQLHELQSKAKG